METMTEAPATERQMSTLQDMIADLEELNPSRGAAIGGKLAEAQAEGGLTKPRASRWITRLGSILKEERAARRHDALTRPVAAPGTGTPATGTPATPGPSHGHTGTDAAPPEPPEGRYAVEDGEGILRFFQVTRGKKDKRLILQQLFGSPGDWRKKELRGGEREAVLFRIDAVTPMMAMKRFGMEFQICGRCAAPLSDATSRQMHFGPDCAVVMGVGDLYRTLDQRNREMGLK